LIVIRTAVIRIRATTTSNRWQRHRRSVSMFLALLAELLWGHFFHTTATRWLACRRRIILYAFSTRIFTRRLSRASRKRRRHVPKNRSSQRRLLKGSLSNRSYTRTRLSSKVSRRYVSSGC
jgi:hypothetical protein